ncbi:hypothetical protein Tdes44962_MAKER01682 [Teratosphaeria destructans]|uniref:DUF7730 domain-containing protein n=1 Tax=Teratosphaeria destructans TaxID=418781 RepID=A0A9W7SY17_9PEZI|nr:hypothetical protein Tdes44962_MAKER01682 [Teratosphaeria destructans]
MDAAPAQSPLHKLPAELRNAIYEHAFDTVVRTTSRPPAPRIDHGQTPDATAELHRARAVEKFGLHRDGSGGVTKTAIGLLGTCRTVRKETLQLFFHTVKIVLHCDEYTTGIARALLGGLHPDALPAIRTLTLELGTISAEDPDVEEIIATVSRHIDDRKTWLPSLRSFPIGVNYAGVLRLEVDASDLAASADRCLESVNAAFRDRRSVVGRWDDRSRFQCYCALLQLNHIAIEGRKGVVVRQDGLGGYP